MKRWNTEKVGLFDINFDTGERYWSTELRNIMGIAEGAEAEFATFLQRVHSADRRTFAALAMQPFRPDCPAHNSSEFRVVHEDGEVHWVHVELVITFRANQIHDAVRVAGFVMEIAAPAERPRLRPSVDFRDHVFHRAAQTA